MKTTGATWYPGELSPHFFYIDGMLSGMAAAIPRKYEAAQKWEAFDMRQVKTESEAPLPLGQYDSVELAKNRVEAVVLTPVK